MSSTWQRLAAIGAVLSVAGAVHATANLRALRRPPAPRGPVLEAVSILIPARDEERRIGATVASVLAQRNLPELTVTVLDDASGDETAAAARRAGRGDARLRVRREERDPPAGWLGKPFACQRLADAADGSVLVFLDADVVLHPDAVSAAVAALRTDNADFGSLWPQQLADGVLARLIQPLQQWSWATTLPLRRATQSPRPSLAAANGQFLVVTREAYRTVGGHAAVADCVLEDIELARAMKRAGLRTALWDGSALASCRMYDSAPALLAGYRKSLWAAFGPRRAPLIVRTAAAVGAWCVLGLAYLVPPAAVIAGPGRRTRLVGLAGCAAAAGNRAIVARRTGSPVWPDSAGHAASIVLLIALSADSLVAHARGRTRWKGRPVTATSGPPATPVPVPPIG